MAQFEVMCHSCGHWLGESPAVLRLAGVFRHARERNSIQGQRSSWRCGKCGWTNTFLEAATMTTDAPWRCVELKERTAKA